MICPKCGCEYREGFTRCADCHVDLVEQLEIECEKEPGNQDFGEELNLVMVKNAANDYEASLIMNLLEENNIPCIRKDREAGGYLKITMGYSIYGSDIYVDEKDYDAARELIDSLQTRTDDESNDKEPTERISPALKARRIITRIWLILIVLAFIFIMLQNNIKLF